MSDLAREKCKRFDALKALRGTWEWHWQQVADVMFPNHAPFDAMAYPGEKRMQNVFDATAIHSSELLAAGLHGMLTNPATVWFQPGIQGMLAPNKRVATWLDLVERGMYSEINHEQAGFSTHIHEMYLEYIDFGTGVLYTGEPADLNGLLFSSVPLNEA